MALNSFGVSVGVAVVIASAGMIAMSFANKPAAVSDAEISALSNEVAEQQIALSEAASPSAPEEEPPSQEVLQRNSRYQEYEVLSHDGPAVSGRDFEQKIMCKGVIENAENNFWALRSLALTRSENEFASFLGRQADGQPISVTLIFSEDSPRRPQFLALEGRTVAACTPG